MNKPVKWTLLGLVFALAAIQAVPVDRTNPPIETEVPAPDAVRAVLRGSCYDCHSHESAWPWYSRVAPVSWLVARDVCEARSELNFSAWNRRSAEDQAEAPEEIWEEVEEGEMPPWFYLPLHREARLSDADRAILRDWAAASGSRSGHGEGDDGPGG
jgi:hypothetical protein